MTELAKWAWLLFIIVFFVGAKFVLILIAEIVLILFLYWINPKWFEPK